MSTQIKIPTVGESITEVQISEWLKSEGDAVKQDEPIAVIDSEKTTFDLPAPRAGKLVKILHQAGDTVPIGEVVGQMESDGEPAKTVPGANEAPKKAGKIKSKTEKLEPVEGSKQEEKEQAESEKETAPSAIEKESASEEEKPEPKTDPKPEAKVPDPEPAPAAKKQTSSSGREEEVVPMTMLRRAVAHNLVEARQTMAMLTTFNEADLSAVQTLRKEHQEAFEKRYQVKLGFMSFFVKAAIDALKQFPQLNAEVREKDIVYHNYFDLGVAIATEREARRARAAGRRTPKFCRIGKGHQRFRPAGKGGQAQTR